ncbi:MAG: ABC transporter ATP-binding protein [Kiritimatiellae bacterium]|nr:ABC transporter ATP-binding protein [Kiritimatiellia bacterium]
MIGVALATRDLVKRYGRRLALDGFTLAVPRGAMMGLVGANGAGKTTWMMAVAGFLRLASGTIDLLGRGPFDATVHSGRFSILPQDSDLPLEARPGDLLYRYARMQGLSAGAARRSASEMLAAVNLADRARSSVRSLSHGMRMRVRLAQCFLGSPEVVLLDEPLNGLDPVEADRIRRFLRARRGKQTIVISSHNLHDVETLCTHVAFVEKGRMARMSAMEAITRATSSVTYVLSAEPADRAALETAVPGATFAWTETTRSLACTFAGSSGGVAAVNRRLLPALLAQTDVISVSSGLSLEQAYLGADLV